MMRSTLCAGTAGLLSLCLLPAAVAETNFQTVAYVSADFTGTNSRLAPLEKPKLSDSTNYQVVLKAAQNHPNVYVGEAWMTELLSDEALTPDEHARVLYARAQHRWKKSSNKIGAREDFTTFTELYPDDLYARNAGIEAGYVSTEIGYVEARMEELQTFSDWFDDAWALGLRAEAAGRYKRSGFLPEPYELELLQAAGYICDSSQNAPPNGFNPVSEEAPNLHWCE